MVKVFKGSDLLPEALEATSGDQLFDPKDVIAFLLTECSPKDEKTAIALAMARRLYALEQACIYCRDQRGDDRCWKDWEKVYTLLPGGYVPPVIDSTVELKNCERYIASCHDPKVEYVSPQRRIDELEQENAQMHTLLAAAKAVFECCRHCGESEVVTVLGDTKCKGCGTRRVGEREKIREEEGPETPGVPGNHSPLHRYERVHPRRVRDDRGPARDSPEQVEKPQDGGGRHHV